MPQNDDTERDTDATEEQLAELRRLGVAEVNLRGLTSEDAEEWIDELRSERIDANRPDRA